MMKELFDRLPRLWQRILTEIWLPAILAVGWFVFAYFQRKSLYDSGAAAAWIFFFRVFPAGPVSAYEEERQ